MAEAAAIAKTAWETRGSARAGIRYEVRVTLHENMAGDIALARDAALACRLAVEAMEVEPGPYNITGRHIVLEQDTADLVKRYFGDQVEVHNDLVGRMSPLSCARAEEAFGYRPQYDWSVHRRYPE